MSDMFLNTKFSLLLLIIGVMVILLVVIIPALWRLLEHLKLKPSKINHRIISTNYRYVSHLRSKSFTNKLLTKILLILLLLIVFANISKPIFNILMLVGSLYLANLFFSNDNKADKRLANLYFMNYAIKQEILHGSRVNLSGADLKGAVFAEINLKGAILKQADLRNARLIGVDLSNAELTNANLEGANLTYSNLQGSHLLGVTMPNGETYYEGMDLEIFTNPEHPHFYTQIAPA